MRVSPKALLYTQRLLQTPEASCTCAAEQDAGNHVVPKDIVADASGKYNSSMDLFPVGRTCSARLTLLSVSFEASPKPPVTHKCSHPWDSVFSTTI